jgi:hypothetical protein
LKKQEKKRERNPECQQKKISQELITFEI